MDIIDAIMFFLAIANSFFVSLFVSVDPQKFYLCPYLFVFSVKLNI